MAALSEVTHAYRLNRDNISVFELRQEARSWQENFTWTSWMLHNTRVENLAFSSNSATFGQAAQRQQMPRQTEADRQKLSALLCTDLLLPLCELFNLEPEVAMELLDSYFCEQPSCTAAVWAAQASNGGGTCAQQIAWVQANIPGQADLVVACDYVARQSDTPECSPCGFGPPSPPVPPQPHLLL